MLNYDVLYAYEHNIYERIEFDYIIIGNNVLKLLIHIFIIIIIGVSFIISVYSNYGWKPET